MQNKKYYTTGAFAKRARVTIRTIRYYDKRGILKPSYRAENGYRMYTDEDFARLQKILSLKYLGFSLEEIIALTINEDKVNINQSLQMQKELVSKRIRHLQMMEKALEETQDVLEESQSTDWNQILNLIHMTSMEHALIDHYKNTVNLDVRIELHRRYSQNPIPWFDWLYQQISFRNAERILELGCGNGELWACANKQDLQDKTVYLTDISSGMVEDVQKRMTENNLGDFLYQMADCQNIPFEKNMFQVVIANHVLFYAKNMGQALSEIERVMTEDGIFYCTTYGKGHMREITELVQEFDSRIQLSEIALYEIFGLENGKEILEKQFNSVELELYEDELIVDEVEPLLDYILSCHGNQSEILSTRQLEFKQFLQEKMNEKGFIEIQKCAGLFKCSNKNKKIAENT